MASWVPSFLRNSRGLVGPIRVLAAIVPLTLPMGSSPDSPYVHTFVNVADPSNLNKHGPAPTLLSIYAFLRAIKSSVLTSSLFQPDPRVYGVTTTTHFQADGSLLRIPRMLFVCLRQVEIIEREFIYTGKEGKCFEGQWVHLRSINPRENVSLPAGFRAKNRNRLKLSGC